MRKGIVSIEFRDVGGITFDFGDSDGITFENGEDFISPSRNYEQKYDIKSPHFQM